MGFCDACEIWTQFNRLKEPWKCSECGSERFSWKHGKQITTVRTFNPGKYKAPTKKESGA